MGDTYASDPLALMPGTAIRLASRAFHHRSRRGQLHRSDHRLRNDGPAGSGTEGTWAVG